MAIRKDITWRGVTIKRAYIRIDSIRGGKRENRVVPTAEGESVWSGEVSIYADRNEPVPVLTAGVTIPFDPAVPPMAALYTALKLLPDFAGSEDDI